MRVLYIILCSFQILFGQGTDQKMIVSAYIETHKAAQSLYALEKFFQEDEDAFHLKERYNLSLGMELLDPYVAVTIKPIKSSEVKNKLRYLLQKKFPQNFAVDNTPIMQKSIPKKPKVSVHTPKKLEVFKKKEVVAEVKKHSLDKYAQVKTFFKTMDSEWWGLIFLALAGFILIARSARQMSKIRSLQKEVMKYQSKVEGEMESMGEGHG